MARAGTKHKVSMDDDINKSCRRTKLKQPIDVKSLCENAGGNLHFELEIPEDPKDEMKENIDKKQKKQRLAYFENCKLRNITAKAVSDDSPDTTVLLSSFEYLSSKFENVTDDGGVKKKLERVGNGSSPPLNGRVWIHYEAWLEESDEPVDATTKKPFSFKLFQNDVLAVLEYGVATMEMKEKSRFLATPEYAYGPLGLPGKVPPDSTVLFIIELVDFMEASSINTVFKMTAEERSLLNFEEVLKACNELKTIANQYCRGNQWESAIPKYRKAIHMMERYLTTNAAVEKERNEALFTLYNNMAMCNLQLEEYKKTITMCQKALDLPPGTKGNVCKAYYRQAKAEFELGHFEEAKKVCRIALNKEPSNPEVRKFYEQVADRIIEDEKVQKSLCRKMFSKMTLKDEAGKADGNPNKEESKVVDTADIVENPGEEESHSASHFSN